MCFGLVQLFMFLFHLPICPHFLLSSREPLLCLFGLLLAQSIQFSLQGYGVSLHMPQAAAITVQLSFELTHLS